MNLLSFRGMIFLACVGAAGLYFKPWEHTRSPASGVVMGRALDALGQGVAGATVVLRDAKGVVIGRVETENNGDFAFEGCRPGRYRLAAAKLGVGGGERSVMVDPHGRADASIALSDGMTGLGHR